LILYTDEQAEILSRFVKVFDMTYTRFNDLKLAEAQAREAQIELALERVRSRAMAMHKTDELIDAGELLYKELTGLGISSLSVCYVLVNEADKTGVYYGINPVDGQSHEPTGDHAAFRIQSDAVVMGQLAKAGTSSFYSA